MQLSGEMFILALVALLIVGVICLGLLIVLGKVVLRQKRERQQQGNLPIAGSSPSVNHSQSKAEEKYYLTVSDWINYLSNEKAGIINYVLGVSAIAVALVALIYSTSTKTLWTSIADAVVVVALLVYLLIIIFRPSERKGKFAEKILNDIISGKLNTEESIHIAWLEGQKSKKPEQKIS